MSTFWFLRRRRCPRGEDLSAYADGELPQRKRARVAAHLKECATCRRELEALTTLSRDFGCAFRQLAQAAALPRPDMQPWRPADAGHPAPRAGRPRTGLLRRAAAVAAAAFLMVAAVWLLWPSVDTGEAKRSAAQPLPLEVPAEGPATAEEAETWGVSVATWRPLRADVFTLARAGDPEAWAQIKLLGVNGKLLAEEPMRPDKIVEPVHVSDMLLERETKALWSWRFTGERQ